MVTLIKFGLNAADSDENVQEDSDWKTPTPLHIIILVFDAKFG